MGEAKDIQIRQHIADDEAREGDDQTRFLSDGFFYSRDMTRIPCSKCTKPTIWDPTYQDLCYRCIRADNE